MHGGSLGRTRDRRARRARARLDTGASAHRTVRHRSRGGRGADPSRRPPGGSPTPDPDRGPAWRTRARPPSPRIPASDRPRDPVPAAALEGLTKVFATTPGRRVSRASTKRSGDVARRRRRRRSRRPRRRVLLDARPVGLGQDDDAADDRRLRAADRGPDPAPRRGRHAASRRSSATSTRSSRTTRCSRT